jgi:hypothetical protein
MSVAGLETAIPESERLQTHALDREATTIANNNYYFTKSHAQFFLFSPELRILSNICELHKTTLVAVNSQ